MGYRYLVEISHWWHHLKGLFLSFQKIIKLLKLDRRNSSYGDWKSCVAMIKRGGEGGSWISFNGHNFSSDDPISIFFWFSESLQRDLSNDVFKSKICLGPNLAFFAFGPWAIIHGIGPKLANSLISQIWTLMTPFERSLSKLSENHKIVEIGLTDFKLWRLKEFRLNRGE